MKRAVRYLNVLAILAIGYWIGKDPSPESVVAALLALAGYLGLEVIPTHRANRSRLDHDLRLYEEIRQLFPDNSLYFWREFDFGNSHERESTDPAYDFVHRFADSTHEFLDRRIERRAKAFHKAAKEFVVYHAGNTFPHPMDGTRQHIPPEWEETHPEKWEETIRELNDRSTKMLDAHDALTRIAKRRLYDNGAS